MSSRAPSGACRGSDTPGRWRLYCCICFETLTPEQCASDSNGQKWDVCIGQCAQEAGV